MQKKYRIEYVDWQGVKRHFIDDKPYNFIVYNVQDGSLVDARELGYGQGGWLTADQMGCRFTLARVTEIDDRIWRVISTYDWDIVLYYRDDEIWHADSYNGIEGTIKWLLDKQPDVPQEQIDLWRKQLKCEFLFDEHLKAIHLLYGDS